MPLILVAVSDQDTSLSLRQPLTDDGMTLIDTQDAEGCQKLVGEQNPDCIILDNRLTLSDGSSLTVSLHRAYPHIPILVVTSVEDETLETVFSDGASDIITRPIRVAFLRARVRHLLAQGEIAQLRQREAWYHSIVDNTSEGMFRSSQEGKFLFVNPGLVRMLGYDHVEEVLALKIPDDVYFHPVLQSQLRARFDNTRGMQSFEIELKKKDGQPVVVNVSSIAHRDADGKVQYYEGILIDLSEKRRVEAALLQYGEELQAKTQSLQTINAIADLVYESLDVETVVERALDAVLDYFQVTGATLQLVEEGSEFLRRVASRDLSDTASQLTVMVPMQGTLSGEAIATRELIVSAELQFETRVHPLLRDDLLAGDITQLVVVPLLTQGRAVGTLSLPMHNHRRPTDEERKTLASAGKTIGLAIANAQHVERVEAEVQERLRVEFSEHQQRILAEALRDTAAVLNSNLDQDGVLDQILTQMERVIPSNTSNVMLVEDGYGRVVRSRGYESLGITDQVLMSRRYPVAETANFRWMVETGRALAIPDVSTFRGWVTDEITWWVGSHVSAPIKVEGEVIGFLHVDSAEPFAFDPQHAQALETFADQAGVAIRNARLYDAARQYASQLEDVVKERTAEVEGQRAQLQVILDSTADGLTGAIYGEALTLESIEYMVPRYRYINKALYQLMGYTPEEWQPHTLRSESVTPEQYDLFRREVWHSLFTRGSWKGEQIVRRKDGTEFTASVTVNVVRDGDGNIIGSVTSYRDISQEKALEAQKARFISNAAHELRTPITNLKTRLYLAHKQPDRMATHLDILEQVTDHMKNLVEYLLDLSRIERGTVELRRERIELDSFVADLMQIQRPEAEKKDLSFTFDSAPQTLFVSADAGRINQVITNLIANAITYTASGGTISVRLAVGKGDHLGFAVIEVADTGIGIPAEYLPHIFQPFFQATYNMSGVGLGLSISKEIIDLHGGSIQVESEVGKGTTFRVALRLAEISQPV
jgi:PAS domain S-box-containing protein